LGTDFEDKKEGPMKRFLLTGILGLCVVTCLGVGQVLADETMATEKGHHPRIARAIHELQEAINYMEAAPHDFGGHKADAIQESRKAIEQLKLALQYREKVDDKKGK
jgi:hypothetical protein